MTEFRNAEGQPISEADALAAPLQQDFSLEWDDDKIAYCSRVADEQWAVRVRMNGAYYPRGSVTRTAHMFKPNDGIHRPEESFSAAVRKLIEH